MDTDWYDPPPVFGKVKSIIPYYRKFWSLISPKVSMMSTVPQDCTLELPQEKVYVVDFPNVIFYIYI